MSAVRPLPPEPPRSPRRALPHLGMPKAREDRRAGALTSALAHLLVLLLVTAPFAARTAIVELPQGAGGPGPAGGGGGGRGGTGGATDAERLRYVRVAPPPPPPVAAVPVPQPVPVVPPVVTPPVPEKKPEVAPPIPPVTATVAEARPATAVAPTPGAGGGSGNDGTSGSGPGSGGGVGSGIGTGRGSGVGPGTGGGTQANYPPTALEVFIPPQPTPDRVRGTHIVAEFDIDERGRVLAMRFTETRDGSYNKKLREVLKNMTRWRPGTRPDGTPIRMTAQIAFDLY